MMLMSSQKVCMAREKLKLVANAENMGSVEQELPVVT